ncbi:MAG: fluoride efflux transporter CrcB [Anaerolineales bacterium]|nr:fluoride efflux transporter CrcB [Anaerolineales bacterium]
MLDILLVGLGGFIGSVLRYLLSGLAQQLTRSINFPYGTLTVNLLGCFVIGFLSQLAEARGLFSPEARLVVFIGILGGFTTFSSFGSETFNLASDGQFIPGLVNICLNVVFGLLLVWGGRITAHLIWR